MLVVLAALGLADQSWDQAWDQGWDQNMGVGGTGEVPAGSSSNIYREGSAWVQQTTGELPSAKVIKVSTDAGSVRVSGSDRGNIAYTLRKKAYVGSEEAAKRRFEQFKVTAWTTGEVASFRGQCESVNGRASVDFDIQVPRGVTVVFVRTEGGSVGVNNVRGRTDLQTAGGSITLDAVGGAILAETSGGSIDVGTAGAEVNVSTSGGSITIRNAAGRTRAETSGGSIDVGTIKAAAVLDTAGGSIRALQIQGDLTAETAGGNIDIGDVAGLAKLSTAGGSIRLGSAGGRVDADTAGGSIRLQQVRGGASAETAAGSIYVEFVGQRGAFTDSRFETTAGDIVVVLPSNLGVNVRAGIEMATGHKIIARDFPELKVTSEGGDYPGAPKTVWAEGAINGGGPFVKAQTTLGNIEFRKGK
jgi:DUF4097 and DUF4098 domain-containing protein YvlB